MIPRATLVPRLALLAAAWALLGAPGCNGADENPEPEPIRVPESGADEPDHWVKTFGAYMSDEFRAAYLATPEGERFRVHGERLLDFARREFILESARVDLTKSELDHFYALGDADACKAYVAELEAQPGRAIAPPPQDNPPP